MITVDIDNFESLFTGYMEFIRECRDKTIPAEVYTEDHHIKPRCIGGGNDPENLITLSFADHHRAHYLLAVECLELDIKCSFRYQALCSFHATGTRNRDEVQEWTAEEMQMIAALSSEHSLLSSERMKSFYSNNPEARESRRQWGKAYFAKPGARESSRQWGKAYFAKPGAREAHSEIAKAYFAKPGAREAQSARRKAYFAKPGSHEALREAAKNYYANNPGAAEERGKKIKAFYTNNPEARKAKSKKVKASPTYAMSRAILYGKPFSYLPEFRPSGTVAEHNKEISRGVL